MKSTLRVLTATLALISTLPVLHAEAQVRRHVAQVEDSKSSEDADGLEPTKKREKNTRRKKTPEERTGDWYVRIQQLPILGMAFVSDNGVVDLEIMNSVNKNFHLGPTAVYHFGKNDSKKMKSFNLGVRGDLILGESGNLNDFYISTALFIGYYNSSKTESRTELTNFTVSKCTNTSEGWHRVGAMSIGKIWHLSDDIHITTGLGAVKTKTMGSTNTRGDCPVNPDDDTGVSFPWFDLGVGFKI
ncbi:MAG: hypothetical protein RIR26_1284 [Pseudomonadota bacterium]|jgi:hypothetical protein